jgi:hypothetical protein
MPPVATAHKYLPCVYATGTKKFRTTNQPFN